VIYGKNIIKANKEDADDDANINNSHDQALPRSNYLFQAVVNVLKIRSANKIVCLKRSFFPSLVIRSKNSFHQRSGLAA
jgi:hypothetical protein